MRVPFWGMINYRSSQDLYKLWYTERITSQLKLVVYRLVVKTVYCFFLWIKRKFDDILIFVTHKVRYFFLNYHFCNAQQKIVDHLFFINMPFSPKCRRSDICEISPGRRNSQYAGCTVFWSWLAECWESFLQTDQRRRRWIWIDCKY